MFLKTLSSSNKINNSNYEALFYIECINKSLFKGFSSIKPENIVKDTIQRIDNILYINNTPITLGKKNVYITGAGKATFEITQYLIPLLQPNYVSGIINIPKSYYNSEVKLLNTTIEITAHPIPDEKTFVNSQKQVHFLASLTEEDIVFVIISGGASSLFEVPYEFFSFKDIIETYKLLLVSGLPIQQINKIRKQLSQIKGGKILFMTKARIIGLLVSDIPSTDIGAIGSGPTVPDFISFQECMSILQKSDLIHKIPVSVKNYFSKRAQLNDYSQPSVLENKTDYENFLLCSNKTLLAVIQDVMNSYGISTNICSDIFSGDAREISSFLSKYTNFPYISLPVCFLYGGESTVRIATQEFNSSTGGRNQELVLNFICDYLERDSITNVILVSLGTDGIDGNSTNAGAFFSNECHKGTLPTISFLKENLFSHNSAICLPSECYIKTGPTGTNVGDIIILILY